MSDILHTNLILKTMINFDLIKERRVNKVRDRAVRKSMKQIAEESICEHEIETAFIAFRASTSARVYKREGERDRERESVSVNKYNVPPSVPNCPGPRVKPLFGRSVV